MHILYPICEIIGYHKYDFDRFVLSNNFSKRFSSYQNLYLWLIIKFTKGLGLGLHWVLSEAWLIKISSPKIRPKAIAVYAVSMSLGFAGAGNNLGFWTHNIFTFLLYICCASHYRYPFLFIKKYEPSIMLGSKSSPIKLILRFPTVVAACVVAGGIDLAMLSLLPAIVMRSPTRTLLSLQQ